MFAGYGIAFVVGFGGIVALITAAATPGHGRQHERLTSPAPFTILMITAVAIAVPFGIMLFSQIWKGGVWLYEDRLEVHSQFFGWSCDTWALNDLAGVGLVFIGRGIGQVAESLWNAVFWRSPDDVELESSIFMQARWPSTDPHKMSDKIAAARAGKIMTAVYEQAQRIQGADGPIHHPVDPSPAALAADGTVSALWTPYGGYKDFKDLGKTSSDGLEVFQSEPGQHPPS
jgi:hypothetical protein